MFKLLDFQITLSGQGLFVVVVVVVVVVGTFRITPADPRHANSGLLLPYRLAGDETIRFRRITSRR